MGSTSDNYPTMNKKQSAQEADDENVIVWTSVRAEAAQQARKDAATTTTTTMNNKQSAKEADGEM